MERFLSTVESRSAYMSVMTISMVSTICPRLREVGVRVAWIWTYNPLISLDFTGQILHQALSCVLGHPA
jgi:hypothetical protein